MLSPNLTRNMTTANATNIINNKIDENRFRGGCKTPFTPEESSSDLRLMSSQLPHLNLRKQSVIQSNAQQRLVMHSNQSAMKASADLSKKQPVFVPSTAGTGCMTTENSPRKSKSPPTILKQPTRGEL